MMNNFSVVKIIIRLVLGALSPILFGSIVMATIGVCSTGFYGGKLSIAMNHFFDMYLISLFIGSISLGIQSVIYSFLMEFAVLPYIKRKGLVILASICVCCMFPLPLYFIDRSLFSYNDIELILIYLLSACITGAVVGYGLYSYYHRQYDQILKKTINQTQD